METEQREEDQAKSLEVRTIAPPQQDRIVCREARFVTPNEKKTRYHLPSELDSASPVGFRTRLNLTQDEAAQALRLLSLSRPAAFVEGPAVTEQELFEEVSLGVLTSRQSTNYRGHRQVSFGPKGSAEIAGLLNGMVGGAVPVLSGAAMTHIVLSKPYRTPFTMLLTLAGHRPVLNLLTVPLRIFRKRFRQASDIPTIGYLQPLHVGILADACERAAVIASEGRRRAQVHLAPFCGVNRALNQAAIKGLERLCGLTGKERLAGWRVALVAQVGAVPPDAISDLAPSLFRKLGANLMAFRSERIQPGVNQEASAPPAYQTRQAMDVSEDFSVMAGRAAHNAFAHWSGCPRERSKELLLLDRIDIRSDGGKERLRELRAELGWITDELVKRLPLWADLPAGRAFSRNAGRGRRAFSLAGQRVYIAGLSFEAMAAAGIDLELGICAVGAAASRSALYAELMGCVDVPAGADLLAGCCMMAGPVNQNDVGKQFYGVPDLLKATFPHQDPTSLLVWTLKAKTVADPIGNEEQLLNARRKGALVDLRGGPHDMVQIVRAGVRRAMRHQDCRVNSERAFADAGNFVTGPEGREIPGNRGSAWPESARHSHVWGEA